MKINLSNLKWIVLPLMLLTIAVSNVMADVDDLSVSAPVLADSMIVAQDSAQSTVGFHANFNHMVVEYPFWFAVLASATAALLVLFLFFGLLRPRLSVAPILAYHDKTDKKNQKQSRRCEVLIKNAGLFPCNDIRVEVSMHLLSDSGDETHVVIDEQKYLSIAGCLRNENASALLIHFNIDPMKKNGETFFPKRILIEILAQNALSGIILPTQRIFTTNDLQEGHYVKSTFVESGNSYKQAVMKANIKNLKKHSLALTIFWIVASTLIAVYMGSSILMKCGFILLLWIAISLCVIIWQIKVYSKADAFTMNNIANIVKATIIELHEHKHIGSGIVRKTDVEDIEPAKEEPESNDPKH